VYRVLEATLPSLCHVNQFLLQQLLLLLLLLLLATQTFYSCSSLGCRTITEFNRCR